jgi:hypothetical protein
VGKVEDLADRFANYLSVPRSQANIAAERVLMIVYDKELERTLRERLSEFETRTVAAKRTWKQFDCTRLFAEWMASLDYRDSYFREPDHLSPKIEGEFRKLVVNRLREALLGSDDHTVLAITGTASLYGFVRLSEIIRDVEADVRGCLAVFFPGTKDQTNYKLLDARDGFNYLAHSISLNSDGGR